ncbi:MAG: hypothetical protein ABUS47_00985 [Steroidobacter sp.]
MNALLECMIAGTDATSANNAALNIVPSPNTTGPKNAATPRDAENAIAVIAQRVHIFQRGTKEMAASVASANGMLEMSQGKDPNADSKLCRHMNGLATTQVATTVSTIRYAFSHLMHSNVFYLEPVSKCNER